MASTKREYKYQNIPGPTGGYVALGIYAPDTNLFTRDGKYAAFMGGCGVGHAPTLKQAEKILLQRTKEMLERRIFEAQRTVDHYRTELAALEETGLVEQTVEQALADVNREAGRR